MAHDVFISYSNNDKATADATCHALEDHMIKCWMAPRDIILGGEYGTAIRDAIANCKVFLLIFSETAALSQWVESELNLAFSERKIIIPYRVDETHLKGAMRLMLNHLNWIDACQNIQELVKHISLLLGVASDERTINITPNDKSVSSSTYDIFISSKSTDYDQAEVVFNFLKNNGHNPFLAKDSIRRMGSADYGETIDNAIDECRHMIVYGSKVEHIKSKYVKYEWSTFNEEWKAGRKNGNIITIRDSSISIGSLPLALRTKQTFTIEEYEDELLFFVE